MVCQGRIICSSEKTKISLQPAFVTHIVIDMLCERFLQFFMLSDAWERSTGPVLPGDHMLCKSNQIMKSELPALKHQSSSLAE
jgi:hypothetical protein